MNDFLYHELLAEEYRRDQMAASEKHNRFARFSENKMTLSMYYALSKVGAVLESGGARMQARYNCLARREQSDMLLNPAK